jgi:hypothetical protein
MSRDSSNFKKCVKEMYKSGCSIAEIAKYKERTENEIQEIIISFGLLQILGSHSSNILGSKKEPYYKTEWEMMYEPHYSYNSLSPSEKEIYDKSRTDK